jgi:hypothetical protein
MEYTHELMLECHEKRMGGNMRHLMIIRPDGGICDCYGEIEENSNFEVVCYDEENDGIWATGNHDTNEPFKDWEEAVKWLCENLDSRIEQLTAV